MGNKIKGKHVAFLCFVFFSAMIWVSLFLEKEGSLQIIAKLFRLITFIPL